MQARQRAAEFQRVAEMQVRTTNPPASHTQALMSRAGSHPCDMRRVCICSSRPRGHSPQACRVPCAAFVLWLIHRLRAFARQEHGTQSLLCAGCSARRRCSESQRCSGRRSSRSSTARWPVASRRPSSSRPAPADRWTCPSRLQHACGGNGGGICWSDAAGGSSLAAPPRWASLCGVHRRRQRCTAVASRHGSRRLRQPAAAVGAASLCPARLLRGSDGALRAVA